MSFPGFQDPLNSFFHTTITLKPDVTNHLTSHFGTFLAPMQNYRIYILRSMVTGSTHASHCVTQPIYATVTKDYYAHKSMRHRNIPHDFQKFPYISISNFPEFT